MRYMLLACLLFVVMGLTGCEKSPHDAIWGKATLGMEEISAACNDLKAGSKPLSEVAQGFHSGSQKLQSAATELRGLSLTQQEKLAAQRPYVARLKKAIDNAKNTQPPASIATSPDAKILMASLLEMAEAAFAWDEVTGVASPAQLAQNRVEIEQVRSMARMMGVGPNAGGTPNMADTRSALASAQQGLAAQPGSIPGMPGGFSLPPGGPGGVNTAPATAMASSLPALPPLPTASTGVGLPSLPNTTPTIGATATLPPLPGNTPAAAGATATLPPLGGASNPMGSLPPTPGMPGTSGPMTDLSSMQKKSQVLTSPEHQTILKDFASAGADLIGSFKQATNKKGAVFAKGQCNRTCDKIKALAKKLDKLPPMSESDATIFHRSYDEMSDALSSAVNNASQLVRTQYPPLTVTINTIAVDLRKALDIMSESVNGAEGKAIATVDQERKDSSNSSQEESKPQPVPGVTPASTEPQENNPDAFGKEE